MFGSMYEVRKHAQVHRPFNKFEIVKSAFLKKCVLYTHTPAKTYLVADEAWLEVVEDAVETLLFELASLSTVKASIVFHVVFEKLAPSDDSPDDTLEHCIKPKSFEITRKEDIRDSLDSALKIIENRILSYLESGSGWTVKDITAIDLQVGKCPPLNGTCSTLAINSLQQLGKLKCSRTDPLDCFAKCVAWSFIPNASPSELNSFISANIRGTNGPMLVSEIRSFEKQNSHLNLKINVLYSDRTSVFPLWKSSSKGTHVVNLLMYEVKMRPDIIRHYMIIENLDKLLARRYRGETGKLSYRKGSHCVNCLQHFPTQHGLSDHEVFCHNFQPQKIIVPDKTNFHVRFGSKMSKIYPCPIVIFFDFEAINKPNAWNCSKCASNHCEHKTMKPCTQKAICYSFMVMTRSGSILHHTRYSGEDAASHFMSSLFDIEDSLLEHITTHKMIWMTPEAEISFQRAVICHLCGWALGVNKVRDHDHITGLYIGAAHNLCNLARKEKKKIPVFCHNLRGYDSHFIIKEIGKDSRLLFASALPANGEKLRSFKLNSYIFVDSYDFLQAPLATLVSDLTEAGHNFGMLDKSGLYEAGDNNTKSLLLRKGVYCYEWASSFKKIQ